MAILTLLLGQTADPDTENYKDDITPVPEDDETFQKYIQDRRVIGVSDHLLERIGWYRLRWHVVYPGWDVMEMDEQHAFTQLPDGCRCPCAATVKWLFGASLPIPQHLVDTRRAAANPLT